MHAQDDAVLGQSDLDVVNLAAFVSGADEILRPVLDPLDRALELRVYFV